MLYLCLPQEDNISDDEELMSTWRTMDSIIRASEQGLGGEETCTSGKGCLYGTQCLLS